MTYSYMDMKETSYSVIIIIVIIMCAGNKFFLYRNTKSKWSLDPLLFLCYQMLGQNLCGSMLSGEKKNCIYLLWKFGRIHFLYEK